MNDLISRQQVIDHWRLIIDATNTDSRYNMGFVDGLEFCISHLSTMPSAQSEIIRCKDCKHGVLDDGFPHQYFCVFKGDEWNNADYFCGHAKRREVDDEGNRCG